MWRKKNAGVRRALEPLSFAVIERPNKRSFRRVRIGGGPETLIFGGRLKKRANLQTNRAYKKVVAKIKRDLIDAGLNKCNGE